jgi:hypothetical protein
MRIENLLGQGHVRFASSILGGNQGIGLTIPQSLLMRADEVIQ